MKHRHTFFYILVFVLVAATLWIWGIPSGQPVQSDEFPRGAILTKEEAIERKLLFDKTAEILDARLLYHQEARQLLNAAEANYEISWYKPDDPVWVIAVKSDDVQKMPMASNEHNGVIYITNAIDGAGSSMIYVPDIENSDILQQLKGAPDRTGEIEIIPRARPTSAVPIQPSPTPIPKVFGTE